MIFSVKTKPGSVDHTIEDIGIVIHGNGGYLNVIQNDEINDFNNSDDFKSAVTLGDLIVNTDIDLSGSDLSFSAALNWIKDSPIYFENGKWKIINPDSTAQEIGNVFLSSLTQATPPNDAQNSSSVVPRSVLDSRAGGLLTNGTGLLGAANSILNPSKKILYNFNPAGAHFLNRYNVEQDGRLLDGVGAGITVNGMILFGTRGAIFDEILAVNPNTVYRGIASVTPNAQAAASGRRIYLGHTFVDLNGNEITSHQHMHSGLAKLANDLTLGTDTWIYIVRDDDFLGNLDPHVEWIIGVDDATYALRRGPIFWDHCYADQQLDADGNGKPFTKINDVGNPLKPAGFGYSRHYIYDLWDSVTGQWERANDGSGAGNWNGYTNVWRHPIKTNHGPHHGHSYAPTATATFIPEGTWISKNRHGGTYKYAYAAGTPLTDSKKFYRFEGWVGGMDYSGSNRAQNFPPGCAGASWMMLACYRGVDGENHTISAMGLSEDPSVITRFVQQSGSIPEHFYPKLLKPDVNSTGQVTTLNINASSPRFSVGKRI